MCPTDRPDDEPISDAEDPASNDTGVWPLPPVLDAAPAGSSLDSQDQAVCPEDRNDARAGSKEMPARGGHEPDRTPELPADSAPRIIAAIGQLERLVEDRLTALQTLFDREVRAEATRERIVDRLHAELQDYKQDLLLKVQRPIFLDLIQLHDDIGKMIEAQPAGDLDQAEAMRGTLESIRTAIEDTLYRQGVEPFQNQGDEFDPRRQRSVKTLPTDDPERNKAIASRLRPGFQSGDKVIRPEIVAVHVLRKAAP